MSIESQPHSQQIVRRAFVLLSGGMDSTTCLHKAIHDYAPKSGSIYDDSAMVQNAMDMAAVSWVEAISIDYGQRHKKEMEYAKATCEKFGIKHTILDIGNILSGKSVMLTQEGADAGVAVPDISYSDIKGVSPTYVPFRNGTLLSAITAHAQKWVNEGQQVKDAEPSLDREMNRTTVMAHVEKREAGIYFGAHSEDAQNWAYPDCTPEFIGAMANAIYIGTYHAIRLHAPLQWLNKAEIVKLGYELNVRFEDTWSCYKGESYQCGKCPTCLSRIEAFKIAGVPDFTTYESHLTPYDPKSGDVPF